MIKAGRLRSQPTFRLILCRPPRLTSSWGTAGGDVRAQLDPDASICLPPRRSPLSMRGPPPTVPWRGWLKNVGIRSNSGRDRDVHKGPSDRLCLPPPQPRSPCRRAEALLHARTASPLEADTGGIIFLPRIRAPLVMSRLGHSVRLPEVSRSHAGVATRLRPACSVCGTAYLDM